MQRERKKVLRNSLRQGTRPRVCLDTFILLIKFDAIYCWLTSWTKDSHLSALYLQRTMVSWLIRQREVQHKSSSTSAEKKIQQCPQIISIISLTRHRRITGRYHGLYYCYQFKYHICFSCKYYRNCCIILLYKCWSVVGSLQFL